MCDLEYWKMEYWSSGYHKSESRSQKPEFRITKLIPVGVMEYWSSGYLLLTAAA
jgi:hypothetical protein